LGQFNAGTNLFNFNGSGAQAISGLSSPTFNNLIVAKAGGTLTLGVSAPVAGNLSLNSGIFDLGAFSANRTAAGGTLTVVGGTTLKIGGTGTLPANFSTHSVGATSTIEYSGTNQTVAALNSAQIYGHLTISGSGTKTLAAATTTAGNVTLAGGTLDVSAGNLAMNVTGNWTGNGGALLPRAGTVTFNNGAAGQAINGTSATQTFNNLTVAKGAQTLAVGGSTATLTLNGAMTLTSGTLDAGTATAVNVGGDWTNNGATFTPGFGTVTFNNTAAAQAVNGSAAAQTFNNLAVAKTAQTLSVGGSTTSLGLAGSMTLTSGTFSAGTATAIGIGGNWTNNGGTFTPGGGGNTVSFTGNTANGVNGTAVSQSFNNVTVNKTGSGSLAVGGSTTTLALSGTMTLSAGTFGAGTATAINVGGDWTNNGATFTPAASTVTFNNAAAAQAINGSSAAQTFNSIAVAKTAQTLSVGGSTTALGLSGSVTLTSGTFTAGTATGINVGGNWTNNGGLFTPGAGLVTFNGSGAQAIGGTAATQSFNDLAVNKTAGTLSAAGSTTTLGLKSVTLTLGTFANGTASAINLSGNWTNNGGIFTGGSGAVTFNGGAAQAIGGSAATAFNSLTINNSTGVTLGANESATGVLTLTAGDLNTASFTLTMPAAASSAGTTDVIGNVKRTGFVSGGAALSFGNPFNSIQIISGTAPTDINVNLVKTVPASFTAAVTRTYQITPNGGSGISARVRMHYLDAELNGNTEGAGMKLFRFDGTAWQTQDQTASDTVNNWAERSGVTSFSPWTLNSTEGTPKESSGPATPQKATKGAGTSVNLTFTAACGATNHTVYWGTGPISGSVVWTNSACGLGNGPAATFDPGDPAPGALLYWVIVGQTVLREGSYGQNSSAVEIPEAIGVGSCDRPQVFSGVCP
ncbi:MAG: hypothetical protein ABIP55_11840, partial [Tepidisphaeraceae bacterium]